MNKSDFRYLYYEAGHDIESLFDVNQNYKCSRCGANQIDLSEDLMYGAMSKCK